ncbi:MAG TPA: TrmH family RNA methyltransferase, partial [Gemmatimonadaceae bacterium]|nr:TrmH family RNA methyltransferase [Gemmatimonadaceae bacterium]
MTDSLLDRVRLVLDEPQDPVNIAATVRAMKNMGVGMLRLVRPAEYDRSRIERVAHDTRDVAERIAHYESLDEALGDCVFVAGFTARRRSAKWRVATPREAATEALTHASHGLVAFVFGREDKGLSNDALDRAHVAVTIPTTEHASLNLAQAVLVALYELHLADANATRTVAPPRKDAPVATSEQYERLFADVERALLGLDFFRTRNAELIMRTVRSVAYRAA